MYVTEETLLGKLDEFITSDESEINIINLPYSGFSLFKNLFKRASSDKKVVVVTEQDKNRGSLSKYLEKEKIEYGIKSEDKEKNIIILSYEEALVGTENFDIAIFDDISSFPIHSYSYTSSVLSFLRTRAKKLIAYSFEALIKVADSLKIPIKDDSSFITEPRFILSKLDVRHHITNTVYDYIDYFFRQRRNAIIFVTDNSVMNGMISYLNRVNPMIMNNTYKAEDLKEEDIRELLSNEARPTVIFSTRLRDFIEFETNFEFIISEAFSDLYNYRQFVFLCLRSCLFPKKPGELLLVSRKITEDMNKCKNITRDFNKIIWEKDTIFN